MTAILAYPVLNWKTGRIRTRETKHSSKDQGSIDRYKNLNFHDSHSIMQVFASGELGIQVCSSAVFILRTIEFQGNWHKFFDGINVLNDRRLYVTGLCDMLLF